MSRAGTFFVLALALALAMAGIGCAASATVHAKPAQRRVYLSWRQNAQPGSLTIVKQQLYRNTSGCGQASQSVTPLALSITSTTDANVRSKRSYFYWMTMVDSLGRETPRSNCVVATIP